MTVFGISQGNMPTPAASPKEALGLLPLRPRAGARRVSTLWMEIKHRHPQDINKLLPRSGQPPLSLSYTTPVPESGPGRHCLLMVGVAIPIGTTYLQISAG
jgi:hypothetical protein